MAGEVSIQEVWSAIWNAKVALDRAAKLIDEFQSQQVEKQTKKRRKIKKDVL